MLRVMLAVLAAVLPVWGECRAVGPPQYGTLEIFAYDVSGERVKELEIEVFRFGSRVADITTKGTTVRLPYGDHRLAITVPGFHMVWKDVRVYQPEVAMQVEMNLGFECLTHATTLRGRVKNDSGEAPLWVKAVPMRGTGGGESKVDKSGYFQISGLYYRAYIVMVLQGDAVLHQQVVTMRYNEREPTLNIDLPRRSKQKPL